jgi:hypothetical protein
MKHAGGPWIELDKPGAQRLDLHFGKGDGSKPYQERMSDVLRLVFDTLKQAQSDGVEWILITHGSSTSGAFKTSARSVVRGLMRSPEATPFIVRKDCVQHETAFLVRVNPRKEVGRQ